MKKPSEMPVQTPEEREALYNKMGEWCPRGVTTDQEFVMNDDGDYDWFHRDEENDQWYAILNGNRRVTPDQLVNFRRKVMKKLTIAPARRPGYTIYHGVPGFYELDHNALEQAYLDLTGLVWNGECLESSQEVPLYWLDLYDDIERLTHLQECGAKVWRSLQRRCMFVARHWRQPDPLQFKVSFGTVDMTEADQYIMRSIPYNWRLVREWASLVGADRGFNRPGENLQQHSWIRRDGDKWVPYDRWDIIKDIQTVTGLEEDLIRGRVCEAEEAFRGWPD